MDIFEKTPFPKDPLFLVFSEHSQLSQAILQFQMERTLHERALILRSRFELQHNKHGVYQDQLLCFGGDVAANER